MKMFLGIVVAVIIGHVLARLIEVKLIKLP